VFDNGHYGETGMQASHTAESVELVAVARACGFRETFDIIDEIGLRDFGDRVHNAPTTLFARIVIRTDEPPRVLPPRDGVLLKTRFRRAIGVEWGRAVLVPKRLRVEGGLVLAVSYPVCVDDGLATWKGWKL